jgi:hypothetical protein
VDVGDDLGLDSRLAHRVLDWVAERAPDQVATILETFLPESLARSAEARGFLMNLAAYELADDAGRRWVETFRDMEGPALPARERRYLDSQVESWFSVWEILSVRPEEGIRLRDFLTGAERDVRERAATRAARPRYAMFGRIVKRGLAFTLGIAHPVILAPADAQAVVDQARQDLRRPRGDVDPSALWGPRALLLATLWTRQVEEGWARPRPRLTNTDGDPLVLVSDAYESDASDVGRILERLGKIEGAVMPVGRELDEDPVCVTLTKPGNARMKAWDNTIVARVRVGKGTIEVETNSLRRADAARAVVEEALGGLARHVGRTEEAPDMQPAIDESPTTRRRASSDLPPELEARLVREMKQKHYATWPDEAIPALGDLTPREAARDRRRRVWRDLDVILRQMESDESTYPPDQRFDVSALREELGMPP